MSIDLHQSCIDRLTQITRKALDEIRVRNNLWVSFDTALTLFEGDEAIPRKDNVKDKLIDYVTDYPFAHFVMGALDEILSDRKYDPSDKLLPLDGPMFDDKDSLAASIVSLFCDLPYTYNFTTHFEIRALDDIVHSAEYLAFSGHTRLIANKDGFSEEFPLTTGDEDRDNRILSRSILGMYGTEEHKPGVHFQCQMKGWHRHSFIGSLVHNFEDELKSFFGLSIAINLLNYRWRYNPYPVQRHAYIHRQSIDGWKLIERRSLNKQTSAALDHIILNPSIVNFAGDNKEKYQGIIVYNVKRIHKCLSHGDERLKLASRWFFDSYASESELNGFIDAMVSLEILLGDQDAPEDISLSELLRNRCAYLIGVTQNERHEILKDFNDLYRIRSKIVHRGKSRLSANDRVMLHKLRNICGRVIQREIELLDDKKPNSAD